MSNKQILELANEMIDYFVSLSGFEHRDDIEVRIDNDQASEMESEAVTSISQTHGYCGISLRNDLMMTMADYEKVLFHEIAHCLVREYIMYFQTFIGSDSVDDSLEDDNKSISGVVFEQTDEKVVKRIAKLLEILWHNFPQK